MKLATCHKVHFPNILQTLVHRLSPSLPFFFSHFVAISFARGFHVYPRIHVYRAKARILCIKRGEFSRVIELRLTIYWNWSERHFFSLQWNKKTRNTLLVHRIFPVLWIALSHPLFTPTTLELISRLTINFFFSNSFFEPLVPTHYRYCYVSASLKSLRIIVINKRFCFSKKIDNYKERKNIFSTMHMIK